MKTVSKERPQERREALRVSPRVQNAHPAQLRINRNELLKATLLDISETGARLEVDCALEPGSECEVFWIPVVGLPPLLLDAHCVWKNKQVVAVKFNQLSDKVLHVLKSFVKFHSDNQN